jgi:8-oxo-dGTP diphosphatase
VQGGQVLVCRNRKHGNVYLPGGHVDWGEDSKRALEREWREELGVPGRAGRFLGVVEQRYIARSGPACEISLVFEVRCPQISAKVPPGSAEDHLAFEWVPLKRLKAAGLLPAALAEHLPGWCVRPAAAAARWRGFAH